MAGSVSTPTLHPEQFTVLRAGCQAWFKYAPREATDFVSLG